MKVLVVAIPALRPAYLGCYGNDWVSTPHLDRLAAEGVVFDRHIADCPGAPLRSSWTGRYQFPDASATEDETTERLGPLLQTAGVRFVRTHDLEPDQVRKSLTGKKAQADCLVWLDCSFLGPPWQIADDFLDAYFAEEADEPDDESGEGTEAKGEPLTPWLDPPTGPVDVGDTAWKRLQRTYAAVVTSMDEQVGDLLASLDERGLAEQMMVVVTSECGLPLGEHGLVGDWRPWLHEEMLHLPLIVRLPGGAEAGRRIAALTQPVDLLPTLLEAFGVPVPADVHGHGLLPLLSGEKEEVRAYACSGLRLGDSVEWALRTPDEAFLLPLGDPSRAAQLYVKPDDRWEVNNILQHRLEWAEKLEQTLRAFVAATRQPGPLQPPPLLEM